VSLWDAQPSQEKKGKSAKDLVAKHTFNMDSDPFFLEFNPHVESEKTGKYEILAISNTGKIHLWVWKSTDNSRLQLQPNLTITVANPPEKKNRERAKQLVPNLELTRLKRHIQLWNK